MIMIQLLISFLHFLPHGASTGGWTQTIDLGVKRLVFYHCATAVSPIWLLLKHMHIKTYEILLRLSAYCDKNKKTLILLNKT